MFLTNLLVSVSLFASQSALPLEVGVYQLKSGNAEVCGEYVEISKEDLAEKKLEIGRMMFALQAGTTATEDKTLSCVSTEKVVINQERETLVLNREIIDKCKDKMSTVKSQLDLSTRQITLKHTDTDTYSCKWLKLK